MEKEGNMWERKSDSLLPTLYTRRAIKVDVSEGVCIVRLLLRWNRTTYYSIHMYMSLAGSYVSSFGSVIGPLSTLDLGQSREGS